MARRSATKRATYASAGAAREVQPRLTCVQKAAGKCTTHVSQRTYLLGIISHLVGSDGWFGCSFIDLHFILQNNTPTAVMSDDCDLEL